MERNIKGQFIKGHKLGLRFGAGQKGHNEKHTEEARKKMSLALLGKRKFNYPKNRKSRKFNPETYRKISESLKGKKQPWNSDSNHYSWQGDKVGYKPLHSWLKRKGIKLKYCEKCNSTNKLELANKTGIYDRNFKNWITLCVNCHRKFDAKNPKRKKL